MGGPLSLRVTAGVESSDDWGRADGEKRLAAEAARLHSHATAALRRLNLNLAGGVA